MPVGPGAGSVARRGGFPRASFKGKGGRNTDGLQMAWKGNALRKFSNFIFKLL